MTRTFKHPPEVREEWNRQKREDAKEKFTVHLEPDYIPALVASGELPAGADRRTVRRKLAHILEVEWPELKERYEDLLRRSGRK